MSPCNVALVSVLSYQATCRKCEGRGAFFYRDGELIKEDKPRTGEER